MAVRMASVIHRSQSLTETSFDREQEKHHDSDWTSTNGSSPKLVRRSSISSDYISDTNRTAWGGGRKVVGSSIRRGITNSAGKQHPLPPSSSSSKGKEFFRSMASFIFRGKVGGGGGGRPKSLRFSRTRPPSPASAPPLSRSNSGSTSSSSTQDQGSPAESEGSREGATWHSKASRPHVSFDVEVKTVFIEQMKEEEIRNTFYCRTEYVAFKEAYRTHRDSRTGWCRSNDVLPCSCDSCQDDLVVGGQHIHSKSSTGSPEEDDGHEGLPPPPPSPYGHEGSSAHENENERMRDEPPSPVGAVFQEDSSSGSDVCSDESEERRQVARALRSVRAPPATRRRPHARSRTWGVGSVPIAGHKEGARIKRGGSLDDWGTASRVREAVQCHGAGYAYTTLRNQGFSDLYIKTHFLPES